jgi:uncharacterized membrane protein YjjP (DUF1212 family)
MKQSKNSLIIVLIACGILAVIASGDIANIALSILITGAVPGTNLIIPSWVMILFYVALMCSVSIVFINSTANDIKLKSNKTRKGRMPRRRYSHI